jgi:hypothetical protein
MKEQNTNLPKQVDAEAQKIVEKMSPLEMGKLIYPGGIPVPLKKVPESVILEHLSRYTKQELKRGQFFKIGTNFTFFMDRKAYEKRQQNKH